jgi:hypothetical protein
MEKAIAAFYYRIAPQKYLIAIEVASERRTFCSGKYLLGKEVSGVLGRLANAACAGCLRIIKEW